MSGRYLLCKGRRARQAGISMVELMVSLTISLILLLALYSIFMTTRLSQQSENGLAQMQEDQRMAMTIISQMIQSAGYYSNRLSTSRENLFPASAQYSVPGQFITGSTGASASAPDTVGVRFQVGTDENGVNDGVVNCLGATDANVYSNLLTVDPLALQLTCSVNGGPAVALAGGRRASGTAGAAVPCNSVGYEGISNLKLQYGYDSQLSKSVTQYAAASSGFNWAAVYSVKVTLTMLYCARQGALPTQVSVSRAVLVPNQL